MEFSILPVSLISLICILIIIISILFGIYKKLLMTYILIISNFIIFIFARIFLDVVFNLGFRPIYLSIEYIPNIYTIITSMFIHFEFLHIIGNMFVFFFIGMSFEHRVGWKKFLTIYLISGVCAALTHSIIYLGSEVLLIGASGAIFGIMGAFAFSYPRDEVVMPIPVGFFMILRRIKVIYAVLIFAAIETIIVLIGYQDNTAHFAHLGGLIGGVILASLLIRGKKTDTGNIELTYNYPNSKQKYINIDIKKLRELATNEDHNKILDRIENETLPQVKQLWLDHFFEKIKCPKCKNQLKHTKNNIICEKCGYKNVF
jgi:membrane associated rhomboid family serine protease